VLQVPLPEAVVLNRGAAALQKILGGMTGNDQSG
jgi:hypothetical protein